MKKRDNLKSNVLIMVLLFFLLGCKALPNPDQIPPLSLFNVREGKLINTTDIRAGSPFIIVYFDPDCGHCQDITRNYLDSIAYFGKTELYYISDSKMEKLKVFDQYFKFAKYPTVFLFRDVESRMRNFIRPQTTPCLAVFDNSKEMEVIYDGGTEVGNLLNELSKL